MDYGGAAARRSEAFGLTNLLRRAARGGSSEQIDHHGGDGSDDQRLGERAARTAGETGRRGGSTGLGGGYDSSDQAETQSQGKLSLNPEDTGAESSIAPRFAVTNLRQALGPLSSSSLPINRQRELETASLAAAKAELEHSAKVMSTQSAGIADSNLQRGRLQAWMHQWLGLLTEKLEADIAAMKARVEKGPDDQKRRISMSATKAAQMKESHFLLYLTLLPANKLALITVLEAMRTVGSGGIIDGFKTMKGMMGIGKAVETEYRAETIRSVAGVDSSHWLRTIDPNTQKPSRLLIGSLWRNIGRHLQANENQLFEEDWRSVWTPSWSAIVHTDVGGYLIAALMDVAKVERTATDPTTGRQM